MASTTKQPASTPTSFRARRAALTPPSSLTDAQLLTAAHQSKLIEGWAIFNGLTDAQLLDRLGWVDGLKGAERKVRKLARTTV